jgi:hypothetical protein
MASVTTDCPHREKLGWLEQTYLIGSSMHYNFDIHSLYAKILDDMMDSQSGNGLIPDIAPEYVQFEGGFRDSPEWGSAGIIIPWLLYKWYGDVDAMKRSYPMMKRYVNYLQGKATGHIIDYGLGDWYDLGPEYPGQAQLTPTAVTATAVYYYDLRIISEMSKILGFESDSKIFYDQSELVRLAYLNRFYNETTGVCSTGSQTAYAMSLYTGLIPEKNRKKVFDNLVNSIIKNKYALTSGDIGYHFLVRVLSENGRSDILYKMNNRSDVPGYGYQLRKGATALTESWAALTTSSNDHMMLGHLMEWFYSGLGGIYQADHSVAYNHIIIAPKPVGNVKWVKCSYHSAKGLITSEWEITGNSFTLNFTIPENAVAKIIMPEAFQKAKCIIRDLTKNEEIDLNIIRGEFEIPSGKYVVTAN